MGRHDRRGSNRFVVAATVAAAVAVLLLAGIAFAAWNLLARQKQAPPAKASAPLVSPSKNAATQSPVAERPAARPIPVSHPATDQVVPVLMYHHVLPNPSNSIAISPETFDRQMKWLHDNGYHAVSMTQLIDFVQTGRRLPDKPVLLTFDDDRANQLKNAVPILKKYGFTATFFVTKKWIVGSSKYFMHESDLKKLADEGYDVESHTNSHTFLVAKSEDYAHMKQRLWGETDGMRVWLSDVTGKPVTALAYPGGGVDKLSPRLAKEAGYAVAFTVDTGYVRYGAGDPELLPRWNAGARGLSFGSFVAIFKRAEAESRPKSSKDATRAQ